MYFSAHFRSVGSYLGKAFSDSGQPSSSRLLGAASMMTVLIGWLHVTFHTHTLPEATATAAAAALGTAPYAVNRVTKAWGKEEKSEGDNNGT